MADKAKKGRHSYVDEYQRTVNGEYVYIGDEYEWTSDRKKSLTSLWAAQCIAMLCALAAGCMKDTGMDGRFYVLLPYAAGLVLDGVCVYALARLTAAGARIKNYVFRATACKLPGLNLAAVIAAAVSLAGETAVCFAEHAARPAMLLFLVLEAGNLMFCLVIRKKLNGIKWEKAD